MNTAGLRFFHGTCAEAAAAILAEGARDPFGRLRAREFVREVWPVILGAAGSFWKTADLFVQAGSEYYASAPVALQNVCDSNDASTFSYGEFYVSFGLEKAARYALRGCSGSELLRFIEEAIKVVRILDRGLFERLSVSYSGLMSQLERPPHPVVLELSGIEVSRLRDEGGGQPSLQLIELAIEWQGRDDVAMDPSFRVTDVTSSDITAVYDLKTLSGDDTRNLPLGALENCRTMPSGWGATSWARSV